MEFKDVSHENQGNWKEREVVKLKFQRKRGP